MEKRFIEVLTLAVVVLGFSTIIVFGLSTIGFAHNRNAAAAGYQTGQNVGRELLCSTGAVYTGEVVWANQDLHRIMISGFDGNKIFDVSAAAMTGGLPKVDHFATVKYTLVDGDRIASSVTAISRDEAWLYTPQAYTGTA